MARMILPLITDDHDESSPLRQVAQPVVVFDASIARLADDMAETMYAHRGIGLAANQVGQLLRMVVIDLGRSSRRSPQVFINPRLRKAKGQQRIEEGCLSVPGVRTTPLRYSRVDVEAQDVTGRPFRLRADGLLAVCLQHEIDHLDGILMTSRQTLGLAPLPV